MDVGMTMPAMEANLTGAILEQWAREVDCGPYACLAMGERIPFDSPDIVALLGACAGWTKRVRLNATVFVAQLHAPVMLAKQIASLDVVSGGRIVAGFGVGAREEDYRAVGADWKTRNIAELTRRVAAMKRVWAGEMPCEGMSYRVGPLPVQTGGPPVMAGVRGPKAIRAAAAWAEGVFGMSRGPDLAEIDAYFNAARAAWAAVGTARPRLAMSFWYALGDNAHEQMKRHLRRYFTFYTQAQVENLLPTTGFRGTPGQLRDFLRRIEDLGADEVSLIPTCIDPNEPSRVAEIL